MPDPVVAYELAVPGLGIAMLPRWLAGKDERLEPILEKWHTVPQDIGAVYPARQLMTPKLRVFLDELQSSLKHQLSP